MTRILEYGNQDNYDAKRSVASGWRVYRRVLGYAWRYKAQLAVTVVFSIVVAASFTTIIALGGISLSFLFDDPDKVARQLDGYQEKIRTIVENAPVLPADLDIRFREYIDGLREDTGRGIRTFCVLLVALGFIGGAARFVQEYFAGAIGTKISIRINDEMFTNLLTLSHKFFEGKTTGEVVARFTNDAFMVNKGLASVLVKIVREPIKALFFLVLALSMNVPLTLAVLLVVPPVVYVILRIGKKVKTGARRSLQGVAAMAGVIAETFSGVSIIKSFRMEAYEHGRIAKELKKLEKNLIRMSRADAAVGPITELLMVFAVVGFIVLSYQQVSAGLMTYGSIMTLFFALAAMLDPLRKLTTVNNMVQTSVASAERVFEFIDYRAEIVDRPGAIEIPLLRDAIRFEDVSFSYDGEKDVLTGVTLDIKKGEMVALVGFSGAGKSTVAKLLPRFYDVTVGRITFDGVDLRDATLASLREQISFVPQENILFHETVAGNIAFGRDDLSRERIENAARAANAHEFIAQLSQGYDTFLDERGGNLSGGQRQRIAIARAIIKDPAVLILDEATSSLDSESERLIQQAIDRFVQGRTTLVIAHRLSTVQRADRIVVIDNGRIAEQGTHAELLATDSLYKRLYDQQFGT